MAINNQYMEASFGPGYTGLADVGYTLKDSAGVDVVARTTTGVFEQGGGTYGAIVPTIADNVVTIEWDTGGAFPIYAHESTDQARRIIEHLNADVAESCGTPFDPDGDLP